MVRAQALRVMSSIRVPLVIPLVLLDVKKCMLDPAPYVRTAAASFIVAAVTAADRDDRSRRPEF